MKLYLKYTTGMDIPVFERLNIFQLWFVLLTEQKIMLGWTFQWNWSKLLLFYPSVSSNEGRFFVFQWFLFCLEQPVSECEAFVFQLVRKQMLCISAKINVLSWTVIDNYWSIEYIPFAEWKIVDQQSHLNRWWLVATSIACYGWHRLAYWLIKLFVLMFSTFYTPVGCRTQFCPQPPCMISV